MDTNLLSRVNNNLLQEGATSNQYLRRQELRRQMADGTYDSDQTNQATQPTANVLSQPTLAQTYSSLLNNYNNYTSQLSGQGSQPSSTGSPGTGGTLSIPSWLPSSVSMAGALTGNGLYGTLASNAMKIAGGNIESGIGGLSGLFAGLFSGGKVPSGVVSSGVTGYLQGKDTSEIRNDLVNSGFGYLLGAANPVLGMGYGLARMLGLDVAGGISDYSKSDIQDRFNSGYNGGFWGDKSWTPTSPYNVNDTYSGSGIGNVYGPGSTYKGESSSESQGTYSGGTAYGTTGYGPTSSDTSGDS